MQILAYGSRSEEVQKTQAALNYEGSSRRESLAEDGVFGSLTHARVMEFQQDNQLQVDGKVGPQTRAALQTFLEFIEKNWNNIAGSKTEEDARTRIRAIARQYHTGLGWRPGDQLASTASFFRIAANHSADGWQPQTQTFPPDRGSFADRRIRQGGLSLSTIFRIGYPGGPSSHSIHEITTKAIHNYHIGASGRNIWDIVSWCGIFAMYVYRSAGLNVRWPNLAAGFRGVPVSRRPKPGDYGNVRAANHFFIVTDILPGGGLETIEGNVTRTIGGIRAQTIIKRTDRTIHSVRAAPNPGFFEPRWDIVLGS